MKNEKYYKDTFDEIHVSGDVLEKLKGMKIERETKKNRNKFRYAAAVIAVFAVFLIVANRGSYAIPDDSGNTWYGRTIAYVNGKRVKTRPELRVHKNGSEQWISITSRCDDYEEIDSPFVKGKEKTDIQTAGDAAVYFSAEGEDGGDSSYYEITANDKIADLIREGDKMYLIIGDNLKKIDVTEDMADGECSGTFDMAGEIYHYKVVGKQWVYDITIK